MFEDTAFWINESNCRRDGGRLIIDAPAKTDLFCAPHGAAVHSAPMLGVRMTGDCRLRAQVSFTRAGNYDGAGLILYADDTHWIKICMEATDFGRIAIANVATNGVSDDANGPNITRDAVWLMMVRKGDVFSLHYSLDGDRYEMVRICSLPLPGDVTAALIAQAPVGAGGPRSFSDIRFESVTVKDIRRGE